MMPFRFASLILLFIVCLPACSRGSEATVSELRVTVHLTPNIQELAGSTTATVQADGNQVTFALSPNARLKEVTVGGEEKQVSISGGRLALSLPQRQNPLIVTVDWTCRFADPLPERIVSFEDPTFGVRGAITPKGTFLGGEAGWYPHPLRDPSVITMEVRAPAGVQAVTEGERTAHRTDDGVTLSAWTIRTPRGPLALSAGPYLVNERRHGRTSLYTFFFRENAELAERYLTAVASYLDLYEKLFGPYPFPKFAVVENFLPTGYGFPSYTLLGSGVIRLPFILDSSLPHEIAHCWWGNGVLVDLRGGNWSEGLATYVADHLVLERKSPAEARDYRQRLLADFATLVDPARDFPLRQFSGRVDPASRAIGYGKGALVFHMIRRQIGDEAFYAGLSRVCRERLFREASWDDFIAAFEQTSGQSLAARARPWLDRPGGPRLALAKVELRREEAGWRTSGTVTSDLPGYHGNITLVLASATGDTRRQLPLAGERTPFAVTSASRPQRLALDPDVDLFRLLSPEELPATVNRIKGSKDLTVVTADGREANAQLGLLLESLGQKQAQVVSESASLPAGDLLFYGLPSNQSNLGTLPPGFAVAANFFSVAGERFSQPDDFLFMVLPRFDRPGRVVALSLPLSEAAASKAVPKITHYGRYGYLSFRAGENRAKGLLPPPAGPMVSTFPEASP